MKTKIFRLNGLTVISLLFLSTIACNPKTLSTDDSKKELIALDLQMSDLALIDGFNSAILFYADDSIIKFNDGRMPIIGKTDFANSFDKTNDTRALSWKPIGVEVAASADLGYTWGDWIFATADTTLYGNYFTVWKKQPDGAWKVKLDGGNGAPGPTR